MNLEYEQDRWDMMVACGYNKNYRVQPTVYHFIKGIKGGVDGENVSERVQNLITMGIKRLPVIANSDGSDGEFGSTFHHLPLSAWLAKTLPGSVDAFAGAPPIEIMDIFSQTAVMPYARSRRRITPKSRQTAGYKINARTLTDTGWNTIK